MEKRWPGTACHKLCPRQGEPPRDPRPLGCGNLYLSLPSPKQEFMCHHVAQDRYVHKMLSKTYQARHLPHLPLGEVWMASDWEMKLLASWASCAWVAREALALLVLSMSHIACPQTYACSCQHLDTWLESVCIEIITHIMSSHGILTVHRFNRKKDWNYTNQRKEKLITCIAPDDDSI